MRCSSLVSADCEPLDPFWECANNIIVAPAYCITNTGHPLLESGAKKRMASFSSYSPTSIVLALLSAGMLMLAGCDPAARTGPHSASGVRPLSNARDSAEYLSALRRTGAANGSAALVADPSARVPVLAGDEVTISLDSAECAAQGNTIMISGVASGTLTTNSCYDAGASLHLGPMTADGDLIFSGSGPWGVSLFQLQDSAAPFVVRYDDGYGDADYNDGVISVTVGQADPSLHCTATVQRGAVVVCNVNGSDVTVASWTWTDANGGATVSGPAGGREWSGTAVQNGSVSATISRGGVPVTSPLTASFLVTSRNWAWDSSKWTYSQGTAPACFNARPTTTSTTTWGWNVAKGSCDPRRLAPNPLTDTLSNPSGYSIAQVSVGPNAGLWYVTSVSYQMQTESNLDVNLTASGPNYSIGNASQERLCRQPLGLSSRDPVLVNFYNFNTKCEGQSLAAMFTGLWNHEGFGTGTLNNGHEARGRMAAANTFNDPYSELESWWASSERALRTSIRNTVVTIDQELNAGADPNHVYVKGNWCGSAWRYDPSQSAYTLGSITTTYGCM